MSEGNRKPESGETDPAQVAKVLEIELIQKRAAWQRARAGRQNVRALSFFFLFIIIIGAVCAFYFLFSGERVAELRSQRPDHNEPTADASASP